MNESNNIPSLAKDEEGNLTVAGGSAEAQQYLKNLLRVAEEGFLEVTIDATSIGDQVMDVVNDFTNPANGDSPYNQTEISYVDPQLVNELRDLWVYLSASPEGSVSPGQQIRNKLNTVFGSGNSIIQDFVDSGYIGTSYVNRNNGPQKC